MRWGAFALVFAFLTSASAGIVEDVIGALNRNSFQAADSDLRAYRAQNGVTPEYIEAYSWMARAALIARDYDQAAAYAKETKTLALEQLKRRPLDAEPHLATALGAAIEVQAQTLVARGQRAQAITLLQAAVQTYRNTSVQARLRKNLNLLSFEGRPAPALRTEEFLGSKPPR